MYFWVNCPFKKLVVMVTYEHSDEGDIRFQSEGVLKDGLCNVLVFFDINLPSCSSYQRK